MPDNKSRIRFTFLKSDKRTPIELNDFRFIINDIDGPSNESLATNCRAGVRFIGTAQKTNLLIDNEPPDLNAVGSVDENEGATSRVMFEFEQVYMVEFDNFGNFGYFKDFDMNDDYPIATPLLVECVDPEVEEKLEFKSNGKEVLIETNPIYFDLDSYYITDRAAVELQKVVDILNKYPDLVIEVRSHTDARADDEYNIRLSNNRAIFTVNWIVNHGINPSRINARGYGETQLTNKCSNNVECSEEEHQLNRRTEFVIINKLILNNI
jgi:outer membrane protein OmpA-like peptidoglycan-associated protein